MTKNRNGPNRKYGKRIELRTEQNESNKTETAVYRFSPTINTNKDIWQLFWLTKKMRTSWQSRPWTTLMQHPDRMYSLSALCLAFVWLFQTQTLIVTISTTVWNIQEERLLSCCGMQTSISDNGEKTDNSSASFDVRSVLFVQYLIDTCSTWMD